MSRTNHLLAIAVTVAVGAVVALAGGYQGERLGGVPLFIWFVAGAYAIQWLVFVPSYLNRTEHFFDLTGSLTYQAVAVAGLVLTQQRDLRTVVLAGMVLVWAVRLGAFLFRRVRAAGSDSRFDEMKHNWSEFAMTWTLQGLWVTLTAAAALAAITSGAKTSFGVVGAIGVVVWLVGFGIEAIADRQKSAFRADAANAGRFVTSGLWGWSRHPNYVGEIVLWVGVALVALPALQGWQYLTLISPVFVYLLLTRISGLPMLERSADQRWGGQPDYEDYKASTPVLFPLPWS